MTLAYTLTTAVLDGRYRATDPRHLSICSFEYDDLDACKRFADATMIEHADALLALTIEGAAGVIFEWNRGEFGA